MTQATRRRRVLIVEDEPALRLSYDRAFRPRYDLAFATNGVEALEQLDQHRPDVAVLDMRAARLARPHGQRARRSGPRGARARLPLGAA
jgi:CheY-like chemotaxis protein